MTKIVGLTGGIGSGKTTVARLFQKLGVPVFIADDEARKVFSQTEAQRQIREIFGDAVFTDGMADRKKIAGIVFTDKEKLAALNNIIHPLVQAAFKAWVMQNDHAPFVIKEAAILFESGSYKDCDYIISVTAPIETRLKRVVDRDQTDPESVRNRIHNQWTDTQRADKSDFIIVNDDLQKTELQVNKIYRELT